MPLLSRSIHNLLSLFLGGVLYMDQVVAASPEPLSYELVNTFSHSSQNWTQGLFFNEGVLYEGTGQNGDSRLIKYRDDFETPAYTRTLPGRYFGEGIAVHQGLLYQLTWKSETGFKYDPADLSRKGDFQYKGEGWGITSSGDELWISNGSTDLQQISTEGEVIRTLTVHFDGEPLNYWNELEWINGKIFANRWYDNHIYLIDPQSGEVSHYINLDEFAQNYQDDNSKVLNGVAWNPERQTLWVTGKYWNALYEISLEEF